MTSAPLPVAILAGGLATRLRPLTGSQPKALVEINGEPFISHQLRLLHLRGIYRVVLCVGYLGEMIRDAIGDGRSFGLQVEYSFDGPQLMGTAGALRKAAPLLSEAFFVLYGDSYLQCDYSAVQRAFERSTCLGLMTVYRNDGRWDRSNVQLTGEALVAYDKRAPTPEMHHIDYGLGVLQRRALDLVPDGKPYDLAALYVDLLRHGELAGCEIGERFYEIGSLEGLDALRELLSTKARCAAARCQALR